MIETLRRYWIAGLVLAMVGLHATIIGVIRQQAAQAKISTSCEFDLGSFHVNQVADGEAVRFRIHAVVPEPMRIQCRLKLTNRQNELRQNIEEHLRQLDPSHFKDPTLYEIKNQLMSVVVRSLDENTVEQVLVTELAPIGKMATLAIDPSMIVDHSQDHLVSNQTEEGSEEHHGDSDLESNATDHGSGSTDHGSSGGDHGSSSSSKPKAPAHKSETSSHKPNAPAHKPASTSHAPKETGTKSSHSPSKPKAASH